MRRGVFVAVAVLPLCGLFAAGVERDTASEAEASRIQDHLERAAEALRSGFPPDLTEEQRNARRETLAWLDEYRAAGVFPHNHVRPSERVPVFVDPHGTPCAVGYLLLRSGRQDVVEDVVRANNLILVRELRDDDRFAAWLAARGITLEEADLIQPAYDGPLPGTVESSNYEPATVGLAVATVALASYMAMVEPTRGGLWPDVLALGTTIGHTYLLVHSADTQSVEPKWATQVNALGLVASVGSEIVRIVRRRDSEATEVTSAGGHPYVRPGPNGTEIGLAIRF